MIKKIFITGAAGFIGSHLTKKLYDHYSNSKFILYDKITYAANKKYIGKLLKKESNKHLAQSMIFGHISTYFFLI